MAYYNYRKKFEDRNLSLCGIENKIHAILTNFVFCMTDLTGTESYVKNMPSLLGTYAVVLL